MNKTLLLILCDFLLLNLLALTRWDQPVQEAEPIKTAETSPAAKPEDSELVAAMRAALEDAQTNRARETERLASEAAAHEAAARQALARQRDLEAALQRQSTSNRTVQERLEATRLDAEATRTKLSEAEKAAVAATRTAEAERRQLFDSLKAQQAEAERQRRLLAELEKQQKEAETQRREAEVRIATLNSAVKAAESEKNLLRENVTELKGQIAQVRTEKEKLTEQTTALATGVQKLASQSGELAREVRENTALTANAVFSAFLSNRVQVSFPGRSRDNGTILVTDGIHALAILHSDETSLRWHPTVQPLGKFNLKVTRDGVELPRGPLFFTSTEPRIMAVPVDLKTTASLGIHAFPIAKNPLRFAEAILVSRGGKNFGEVEFTIDPKTPGYVRMKTKIFNRLLGEFSPASGDIVLSKSGEFLGLMVNNEYCAVVSSLASAPSGTIDSQSTTDSISRKLEEYRIWWNNLPAPLR